MAKSMCEVCERNIKELKGAGVEPVIFEISGFDLCSECEKEVICEGCERNRGQFASEKEEIEVSEILEEGLCSDCKEKEERKDEEMCQACGRNMEELEKIEQEQELTEVVGINMCPKCESEYKAGRDHDGITKANKGKDKDITDDWKDRATV